MALKYPDRIESNNPQAYGIVKATEVSGARNAAEYGGLLDIPDNILSASGDGSDALYQLWIDDNSVYRLIDWNNRRNSKGWRVEYAYIPWDSTAHLNSLTQSGQYYISGQSNGLNGGLPILNSDPGHTFDAVLRVLDSSLTKDTDQKQLCITQILSLSNRMGGDGHIFVRTIQTLEKDNLTRTDIESPTCDKWGTWEKLQGIFEKNIVEQPVHLNTYTTNGMYSGVFVNPDTVSGLHINQFDTFLLITVNGYSAAGAAQIAGLNKAPQLTQLLYITPIETGWANLYIRTATWNGSQWRFGNFYRMATSEDINIIRTEALYQFNIVPTKDNVKFVISNLDDFVVGEVNMLQASATQAGVMSAEDKIKLDSVESTANDAKSAAETAQTAATSAQETANSARETATAASTAAQEAKTAAETAQSTATAAQTKNTEQDARLDNIEARIDPDIAGRVWNEDNGTPKAESYYGSVKALRDLPKRLGLGRYIVKDDRTRRKLDPNDSRKYLDGTPAALDGTEGQCMWCWNGFYANVWHEGSRLIKAVTFDGPVGNDISIWIPAGGISWLGAGVMDRTEQKLCSLISDDERYRGGGGTALDASKYTKAPAAESPQITMLGMPATNISTTNFGTYARKRGEGWEANWFVARFVVEFLFEVIMGTENSQEAFNASKDADGLYQGGFGTGVTDMPDWGNYNGTYPVIPTSVGLEAGDGVCLVPYNLPDASGGTYKTFNVPVFFGLVGAGFGNLWQWMRGLIMDAGEEKSLVYVAPSMYAAYDPNTVAGKIMVAECPRVSGWIMRKSYRGLCCMPTDIGGSTTVRYSDYFSTIAEISKGLRVRVAGGNASGGTLTGASCTNANDTATAAKANHSAPLCYFEEDPKIPLSQSIANNN